MNDGIIKFSYEFISNRIPQTKKIEQLNKIRQKFWELKLIGVDENGISYGNISQRLTNNAFLITASQVGIEKTLTAEDYVIIRKADVDLNRVWVEGRKLPSSESLTHYVVYKSNPVINFVIHFHHKKLWEKLFEIVTTTKFNLGCGTKELAQSIFEIISKSENQYCGLIVIGGHRDGLIAYSSRANGLIELVFPYLEDMI